MLDQAATMSLEGYPLGPIALGCANGLTRLLEEHWTDGFDPDLVADHRDGRVMMAWTNDGYSWYAGIVIEVSGVEAAILFPHVTGGRVDRPVSAYAREPISREELDSAALLFLDTLEEMALRAESRE